MASWARWVLTNDKGRLGAEPKRPFDIVVAGFAANNIECRNRPGFRCGNLGPLNTIGPVPLDSSAERP